MRNTLKVAKWEIKKNLKNKSFIIGLFLTPLIFLIFFFVPSLLESTSETEKVDLYVKDELGIIEDLKSDIYENDFIDWKLHETNIDKDDVIKQVQKGENSAFIHLTSDALNHGTIEVYMSEDVDDSFIHQLAVLEEPIRQIQLKEQGFSEEDIAIITNGVHFTQVSNESDDRKIERVEKGKSEADPLKRIIPGAFAGIILFSIVMTGMTIFQSASQEKKEKIAEIILSSLTPNELMQGKIIGYFVLGIIQVTVWLGIALPVAAWKFEIPLLDYLFVPELAVLLTIAILGYLLFASLFVGIGATIEDVSTTGNFQGMVLLLPFLPVIFIGPVINDPSGFIAKVASFIPFSSPGILIIRLSLLEEWPWMQVVIAIVILVFTVWLFMKLAGKIFKTGILLYGKNATPKEIWKWLWA